MAHTGTQLRIAASGPGAQRVIGLTDQTDNFYTIAGALGLGHFHRMRSRRCPTTALTEGLCSPTASSPRPNRLASTATLCSATS